MPCEKETIAKKWKLIQLLTNKGYEFSEKKKQKTVKRFKEIIATATAANLVTEQNDDSTFLHSHIRSRSIQKIAKTLPKCRTKCKEVILAIAKNWTSILSQPNRKQEDQKRSWLKMKNNGSKTFYINTILHMSPQVEKITVMLGKWMVIASMSRNDILRGHSMIY